MKKITSLLLLCLLVSCNAVIPYYQIYETKSETVKPSGNAIVFEDNNCKISYNLWSESGNAGFTFYNKTSEVIYLQLEESFYVINDRAYDYYQNRIFSNSSDTASKTTKTTGFTQWGWLSLSGYTSNTLATNSTSGVEVIEAKVIAVPSKTSKTVSEFKINETLFRDCDLLRFPSSKQTSTKTFSEQSTPIRFYNTITYKLGDKLNKVKNDFYVSQITNIASKDALKLEKNAFCNQKNGGTVSVFKESAPAKFYVSYTKTQADTWKY
ncbi:hypothetical protein IVB69_11740 [Flavobacterium sp. J49]|uniref:hypothetical protein n=1 Tax=Flavobacterium sp. J49 TaxID=2718534 RepID=UPI00159428CF|nr:hypothetical protein [Flavobacterium sp. J49]MBF6642155.1 hypothetical protein [Flavobacterium sp. J49]NIC03402.1 hypothetical protein [Flavobacterium sp. J49]